MEGLFSPVGAASSRDCFQYKDGFPIYFVFFFNAGY
jgi:hypothetical protein